MTIVVELGDLRRFARGLIGAASNEIRAQAGKKLTIQVAESLLGILEQLVTDLDME